MTSSRNDGDDDDHDSDNVLVGDNHARAPATGGDYEWQQGRVPSSRAARGAYDPV